MGELKIEYIKTVFEAPKYNLSFVCKLTGRKILGRRSSGGTGYILFDEEKNEKLTITKFLLRKKYYADPKNKTANLIFSNRPRR